MSAYRCTLLASLFTGLVLIGASIGLAIDADAQDAQCYTDTECCEQFNDCDRGLMEDAIDLEIIEGCEAQPIDERDSECYPK